VAGVFRINGISYLRIPVTDPQRAAVFYRAVFDWKVDADRAEPSFEDGTGHVIGHFVTGQGVTGEDGIRPYVFVERIHDKLDAAVANGGEVVTPPYPEGDLTVAVFRDPEGNAVGVWERADWPRPKGV
jgi:predicted enzyme related to lactoylglutathione lyase